MELREFAEQILFAQNLEEKLVCPGDFTDERPGRPITAPESPGRPAELRFKPRQAGPAGFPGIHQLEQPEPRGRLLHFFANHELLATELMALALLRFPEAPPAFRRGVLQTLKEEQGHTRWYLQRMQDCGIAFGQLPVSGYFWRSVSGMESPLDYLAGLSLTFEQANLDFTRHFARCFAQVGDTQTSRLLERIYHDEIGHVAYGLKWFRKWKDPQQSDWEAFCRQLKFPMSPQRAKGPLFNPEGRLAAGLDRQFIDELNVYSQSKGRTPGVFLFNPFAEGCIARGQSFTPNRRQQLLLQDLENLPQFLCRQDDVVLSTRRPGASFLSAVKQAGFAVPEFVTLQAGEIPAAHSLRLRKLGRLCPWAWGPDSQELLAPLFAQVTLGSRNPSDYYHERVAQLYSKAWSAALLGKLLAEWATAKTRHHPNAVPDDGVEAPGGKAWLCTESEVGVAASTLSGVMAQIEAVRRGGYPKVLLKEAIGVAGHNAIRLLEPVLLETQRRWIVSALENGRQLVIEPWLQRELDFSIQLEMRSGGLTLVGYTGLLNDWKGQYRGNWAEPGYRQRPGLGLEQLLADVPDVTQRIRSLYARVFRLLEQELAQLNYLGPVGIDAFIYRTAQGDCRLKPVVEINPRYTMGRLTLELMKQVAPGRSGTFRLVNRKMVRSDGFEDFVSWARARSERSPLRLAGEPIPRISEGFLCLNEPEHAQACLATFEVFPP